MQIESNAPHGREEIFDQLAVMARKEEELYDYHHFVPMPSLEPNHTLVVDPDRRAYIVKWVRISLPCVIP